MWRIVSIPQYLNGLVVSGHEKGKGKTQNGNKI